MINTPIIGTINISSPWSISYHSMINISSPWSIAYHSMINRFHPRSTAASLHDQQISSMINSLSLDDQHISYMINSAIWDRATIPPFRRRSATYWCLFKLALCLILCKERMWKSVSKKNHRALFSPAKLANSVIVGKLKPKKQPPIFPPKAHPHISIACGSINGSHYQPLCMRTLGDYVAATNM